jgi:predicted metal-binding membrane protein
MLALGVMDLRAMALVTAIINVERLAPGGNRAARPPAPSWSGQVCF